MMEKLWLGDSGQSRRLPLTWQLHQRQWQSARGLPLTWVPWKGPAGHVWLLLQSVHVLNALEPQVARKSGDLTRWQVDYLSPRPAKVRGAVGAAAGWFA